MNGEIDVIRLARAFVEADWTQQQLETLYLTDALFEIRKKMFATPFLDLALEDAFTKEALEDAGQGYGAVHLRLLRILRRKPMKVRDLVTMVERDAVSMLGSSKQNLTVRAVIAVLAKHNLHLGMKFW